MNPFNFFDKIYCINLKHRDDRWASVQVEFAKLNIDVERFEAHTGDNKHLAFNSSQYHVIKKAIADGCNRFLILEDDVVFSNTGHLNTAIKSLPYNWDMIYLGANIIGDDTRKWHKPLRIGNNLCRLFNAWQTQSVGYSRKAGEYILKNFNYDDFPIFDEWLRVNMLPHKLAYIVNPQITYQAPGFSDIWNEQADYTSLLIRGNNVMA